MIADSPASSAATDTSDTDGFIEAAALNKSYGDYPVLRGVDCRIARGEFVAIMGDSGSGKTTFLNLLAGLDVANGGRLTVAGENRPAIPSLTWPNTGDG